MMRRNYLCINPYHYGYEQASSLESKNNHICQRHLRLQVSGSSIHTICKACRKVQTEEDLTDGFFVANQKLAEELIEESTIKLREIEKATKNNEMSIEELDQDFESMLQSIENQVETETNFDTQDEDSKANLELEIGPAANKKRPLEDTTNQNVAKKPKYDHPDGKPFQCWQCLNWFANKIELSKHSCLTELNIMGNHIFCCNFCATCSDDLDLLRSHVSKCKEFNLGPLKCFNKFECVKTSTVGSTKDAITTTPTRSSRRDRKSDSKKHSKCEICEVQFPTKSELVLHNSKPHCKHLTCEKCNKNYAIERTLKSHICDAGNVSDSVDTNKSVDQDIKVIKLDRNKINHQVCLPFTSLKLPKIAYHRSL